MTETMGLAEALLMERATANLTIRAQTLATTEAALETLVNCGLLDEIQTIKVGEALADIASAKVVYGFDH